MRGDRSAVKVQIEQIADDCGAGLDTFVDYGNSKACCKLKMLSLCRCQSGPKCVLGNLSSKSMSRYLHFLSDPLD